MARNLAIFFDGTWNTPDEDGDHEGDTSTNVHKLYDAVRAKTTQNRKQLKWYDEGVGTRWWNKLAGGAFGCGLSKNILQGYEWLMDEYEPGDELYIFGFSRGAYTARSLVGLIRNCGVLDRNKTSKSAKKRRLEEAFQLYKAKDEGPDSPVALKFRQEYSLETDVACLGVWDTVGALGIPLQSFDWFNRRFYEFHDTELSSIVRHGYHALAIDEHRESYEAAIWDPKFKPNQSIEQVWFCGAHSNVGGGYANHDLADIALAWMAEKAGEAKLGIDKRKLPKVTEDNAKGQLVDSYGQFLKGAYAKVRERAMRKMGHTRHGQESVHDTVRTRYNSLADYRPKNPIGETIGGVPDPRFGRLRNL